MVSNVYNSSLGCNSIRRILKIPLKHLILFYSTEKENKITACGSWKLFLRNYFPFVGFLFFKCQAALSVMIFSRQHLLCYVARRHASSYLNFQRSDKIFFLASRYLLNLIPSFLNLQKKSWSLVNIMVSYNLTFLPKSRGHLCNL